MSDGTRRMFRPDARRLRWGVGVLVALALAQLLGGAAALATAASGDVRSRASTFVALAPLTLYVAAELSRYRIEVDATGITRSTWLWPRRTMAFRDVTHVSLLRPGYLELRAGRRTFSLRPKAFGREAAHLVGSVLAGLQVNPAVRVQVPGEEFLVGEWPQRVPGAEAMS